LVFVFAQVLYKLLYPQLPTVETMAAVGALALAANAVCFAVLWRHRAEDINMRSVWLCSRNDLLANALVLFAALAVWITLSPWPDIAVGALICIVFLRSAYLVAREARAELQLNHARPSVAADARKRRAAERSNWSMIVMRIALPAMCDSGGR
jgi:Co/Zn/Cd efflux system component